MGDSRLRTVAVSYHSSDTSYIYIYTYHMLTHSNLRQPIWIRIMSDQSACIISPFIVQQHNLLGCLSLFGISGRHALRGPLEGIGLPFWLVVLLGSMVAAFLGNSFRSIWIYFLGNVDTGTPVYEYGGVPGFSGDSSLLGGNTPILINRGVLIRGQHYKAEIIPAVSPSFPAGQMGLLDWKICPHQPLRR